MKIFKVAATFLLSLGLLLPFVQAEEIVEKVPIEIFEREDCVHCKDAKAYFADLSIKRDDFVLRSQDINEEESNANWLALTELEGVSKSTPIILVGNKVIMGFGAAETTGVMIEDLIDKSVGKGTLDFAAFMEAGGSGGEVLKVDGGSCADDGLCGVDGSVDSSPLLVNIPFYGVIDLKDYSLPVLSVVLGFVDGFNPCAMWVLVTFLIVLSQVGNRKRMWQIAGLFIVAESVMYYMIMNVWMTAWNFVQLDYIVTPIVGVVAMGGGIFFLWEFKNNDGTCKVTNMAQKAKISKRINKLVNAEMTILTVLGILGLALSVNVIEFACSVGIPQAFTKIIELNPMTWAKQQFYLLTYILFYMIDDFIIFGIALYSFEKIGVTAKYSKASNLIGGILMLILGAILIFDPGLLVF